MEAAQRSLASLLLWLVVVCPVLAGEAFDWRQTDELAPGIRYAAATVELPNAAGLTCPHFRGFNPEKPRLVRLHVARIDTRHRAVRFSTTGRADGWGEPMAGNAEGDPNEFVIRTLRQTTRDFARTERAAGRPVLLAINAAPWSPFGGVPRPHADRMGLAVSDGLLVSPANGRPSFVIRDDGSVELLATTAETDLSGIRVAVSGFQFCLSGGTPSAPDQVLHPRTGIGLCAEKRFVFFLVIDGRQEASQGATVRELGEWLRHYGASDGLNMDGGGSTTMVVWKAETETYELVNRPSGGQRMNGSSLGVYLSEKTAAE